MDHTIISSSSFANHPSLHLLQPITLAEMEAVALMDRVETKYVIPISMVWKLLATVSSDYCVLQINQTRMSRYRTLYFDTRPFEMYHHHHAGKGNRYKIRTREYMETGYSFLEIKHKNNKGRTAKIRQSTPFLYQQLGRNSAEFVQEHSPYQSTHLSPVLWNRYQRITLVSCTSQERVTIDTQLSFAYDKVNLSFPELAIVEIKRPSYGDDSVILDLLKQWKAKPQSFSKYCMGISYTHPYLKHNNFKKQRRLVEALQAGEV